MAVKKPVLAYGQTPSDVQKIIQDTGAGTFVPFDDLDHLDNAIDQMFVNFKSGKSIVNPIGIEKFERKRLTGELAKVLDQIIG